MQKTSLACCGNEASHIGEELRFAQSNSSSAARTMSTADFKPSKSTVPMGSTTGCLPHQWMESNNGTISSSKSTGGSRGIDQSVASTSSGLICRFFSSIASSKAANSSTGMGGGSSNASSKGNQAAGSATLGSSPDSSCNFRV